MYPSNQGAIRLFRFAGIDVFLHWSWFLVAAYLIQDRAAEYSSLTWNVLGYLSLFVIVLMHEFGHSLACRQVGGQVHQITLWPLGGIAFVSPPPRPGAVLWSLAAGPLVNVVLAPILYAAVHLSGTEVTLRSLPGIQGLLVNIYIINMVLLIFNMLPIFPLDGGQILRALLWYKLGPVRSLLIATSIGFVGVAGLIFLAIWQRSVMMGVMAAFVFMNCQRAWTQARAARMP